MASVALTSMLGVGAHAQSFSWTGSYVGGYAGWAWGRSHATTSVDCSVPYSSTTYMCDNTDPQNGAAVDASGTGWMYGNTAISGLEGGQNWQLGQYVYGWESDFGAFHIHGARQANGDYVDGYNIIYVDPPFYTDSYTIGTNFETDWLFTLRGRFGWTTEKLFREHDKLWLYATGGLALTDLKVGFNFTDTEGAAGSGSNSRLQPGWALGAGFEYMLDRRWSLKGEYLHIDFGNVCASGTIIEGGGPLNGGYAQGISTCADLNADLVRFGINYRL